MKSLFNLTNGVYWNYMVLDLYFSYIIIDEKYEKKNECEKIKKIIIMFYMNYMYVWSKNLLEKKKIYHQLLIN